MRRILIFLLFVLSGCVNTSIDEHTAKNIGNLYKGCKNSENITIEQADNMSYSERFYCLGLIQGTTETIMYLRRKKRDIQPNCRIKIQDFYNNAFYNVETGYYPPSTPIVNVFYDISYKICPRIR